MTEKTYKYVSICQREKPIQTNNPSTFIQHVASCPTCKSNLPASVIQALQPRLDQIIREKKGAGTTEEPKTTEESNIPSSGKIDKVEVSVGSDKIEDESVEPGPDQPDLQKQFDRHLGDSPVFQGIEKSVTQTKVNVQKISDQVNGLTDKISRDIASLGDTLIERMTGDSGAGQEVVDVGESPEDERKEPAGKVLSTKEEKLQEKGGDLEAGEGRPNPFGSSDKVPAAMRKGYQPGKKVPPEEEVAGEEPPPEDEEGPQGGKTPGKDPSPKGGKDKGLPDLDSPDEVEAVEAWLTKQKKKMEGTGKPETEKKGVIPYIGDLTDTVKAVREVIDAWKGKGEGGGGEPSFSQFAQELVLEMLKKQVASQVAPAPAGADTVSIVQMDAMRNLLGTFFSGLKSMPKEEAKKLVQGLSETSSEETGSSEQIR